MGRQLFIGYLFVFLIFGSCEARKKKEEGERERREGWRKEDLGNLWGQKDRKKKN